MPEAKPEAFRIDYLRGFKILFQDKNALNNLLIASLYVLIPVLGSILLLGWYCEIFQRLHRRHPQPVPRQDFSDFTHYLGRGIPPFITSLIISLPFTFIVLALAFMMMGSITYIVSRELQGPFLVLSALGIGGAIFVLVLLPLVVLSNAALTRAYITEDIGQSLALGKIWEYAKRTWKPLLLAYLVYLPLTFAVMIVGMLMLYIGMYPAIVIIHTAWIVMSWQIYELYLAEGGEIIPMKAPVTLPSEQRAIPSST